MNQGILFFAKFGLLKEYWPKKSDFPQPCNNLALVETLHLKNKVVAIVVAPVALVSYYNPIFSGSGYQHFHKNILAYIFPYYHFYICATYNYFNTIAIYKMLENPYKTASTTCPGNISSVNIIKYYNISHISFAITDITHTDTTFTYKNK